MTCLRCGGDHLARVCKGKPCDSWERVFDAIADRYRAGESIECLARDYCAAVEDIRYVLLWTGEGAP